VYFSFFLLALLGLFLLPTTYGYARQLFRRNRGDEYTTGMDKLKGAPHVLHHVI
jgi:hypothetical protein